MRRRGIVLEFALDAGNVGNQYWSTAYEVPSSATSQVRRIPGLQTENRKPKTSLPMV